MSKEIRLVKGRELGNRGWSVGVRNPNWEPSWIKVTFPGHSILGGSKRSIKNHITVSDGNIDGVPVFYRSPDYDEKNPPSDVVENAGQPVPAEKILEALLREPSNVRNLAYGNGKADQKMHFGMNKKWYVDYDPSLEDLLAKYNLKFETNQTIGEFTFNSVMNSLKMQGIEAPQAAPGRAAIEEALKNKESEEMKALKEKIAALEAEKESLSEAKKPGRKPKEEKETVSA